LLALIITIAVYAPTWPCHEEWYGMPILLGLMRICLIVACSVRLYSNMRSAVIALFLLAVDPVWRSFQKRRRAKGNIQGHRTTDLEHAPGAMPLLFASGPAPHANTASELQNGLTLLMSTPSGSRTLTHQQKLLAIISPFTVVALVVMHLEVLRQINGVPDAGGWGFGQLLSLALAGLPAWRAITIVYELGSHAISRWQSWLRSYRPLPSPILIRVPEVPPPVSPSAKKL
jgi:hypothetical protein